MASPTHPRLNPSSHRARSYPSQESAPAPNLHMQIRPSTSWLLPSAHCLSTTRLFNSPAPPDMRHCTTAPTHRYPTHPLTIQATKARPHTTRPAMTHEQTMLALTAGVPSPYWPKSEDRGNRRKLVRRPIAQAKDSSSWHVEMIWA